MKIELKFYLLLLINFFVQKNIFSYKLFLVKNMAIFLLLHNFTLFIVNGQNIFTVNPFEIRIKSWGYFFLFNGMVSYSGNFIHVSFLKDCR